MSKQITIKTEIKLYCEDCDNDLRVYQNPNGKIYVGRCPCCEGKMVFG